MRSTNPPKHAHAGEHSALLQDRLHGVDPTCSLSCCPSHDASTRTLQVQALASQRLLLNTANPTGRVLRQAVWIFISFSAGYYAANVVSLSFGAIAVNDVIAAVFTVAFVEIVSKIVYEAEKVCTVDLRMSLGCTMTQMSPATRTPPAQWDLKLLFLNFFKMGVSAALIADALKLGG